jgi:hypothetical protein
VYTLVSRGTVVRNEDVTDAGNSSEENTMIGRINHVVGPEFSETELDALQSLRTTYQTGQHVVTERELAHLRFLRWLVRSPGWQRAMDQPVNASERQITTPRSPIWTLGFFA